MIQQGPRRLCSIVNGGSVCARVTGYVWLYNKSSHTMHVGYYHDMYYHMSCSDAVVWMLRVLQMKTARIHS
jgi:hypothetical protein